MLYRYVYLDAWCPLWPNLAASALCSALVYVRLRVHQKRHHEALKQHVTDTIGAANVNVS